MLLVKAGSAVQDMIDKIVPLLESGDIIIDGGNSDYHDSNVRFSFKDFLGKFGVWAHHLILNEVFSRFCKYQFFVSIQNQNGGMSKTGSP